jgi:riboflavin synthase
MFTGIVEETGRVQALVERPEGWRLRVRAGNSARTARLGDSVAVNGCCLTMVARKSGVLEFDLLEKTLRCTALGELRKGSHVNLEQSMRADGRFGGHFVSGHIDAAGIVQILQRRRQNFYLRVSFPKQFANLVVEKGSIAIDGVSLTVAEAGTTFLSVWLIPHTLKVTGLGRLQAGARVNLEFDLLAKYLARMTRRG